MALCGGIEMSDYISRDEIFSVWRSMPKPASIASLTDAINRTPAADVEPVVPCKGCEHAERYARTDGTAGYYCGHPQNTFVYGERWDRVFKPVKKPDDFCSFGEPRGAKK